MYANYHTHTKRCQHAVGEDREYVEAAIAAGIQVLGFRTIAHGSIKMILCPESV